MKRIICWFRGEHDWAWDYVSATQGVAIGKRWVQGYYQYCRTCGGMRGIGE